MDEPKADNESEKSANIANAADRRRPGRVEYLNASLIDLLRRASHARNEHIDDVPEAAEDQSADDAEDDEQKVPLGTSLAFILLISVLLWALVGIGVRLLFG